MVRYVSIKDNENLAKSESAECRKKKEGEDRFGGIAIRDAAMNGEKREKKKRVVKTRSDPLTFLKLSQDAVARRAAEYRDRHQHEEALQLKTVAFQEKQAEIQLQVAQMMASAVLAMAKAVEKFNN
ncbi:unnamed protein product [Phytophthora fragariaefolia]|uniref:Unnamed protein product n=1 Tax=Phytophthora fragariaefolia TaxID=1490495 RepID=A0A9W6TZF1_9STRA|nr:unnamed protein product [Phytophthora fragariaefolia]